MTYDCHEDSYFEHQSAMDGSIPNLTVRVLVKIIQ